MILHSNFLGVWYMKNVMDLNVPTTFRHCIYYLHIFFAAILSDAGP